MNREEFIESSGEHGVGKLARGWTVIPAELDGGQCDYNKCEGWHWVHIESMREKVSMGMRSKEVLQWL